VVIFPAVARDLRVIRSVQTGATTGPIEWVPVAVSPGQSGRGVKLTTRLRLMPKLKIFTPTRTYTFITFLAVTLSARNQHWTLLKRYLRRLSLP